MHNLDRKFLYSEGRLCAKIRLEIGLCSVLRPLQHSIGYMGDGFYRSKDPTNRIKVLEEATKENKNNTKNIMHTEIRNSTRLKDTKIR